MRSADIKKSRRDLFSETSQTSSCASAQLGQMLCNTFGYLQCTCEKYPKVLSINDRMLSFLSTSEKSSNWQEFLRENIFFMLPFEDRDRFREYLEQADASQTPIKIHHRIIKENGERVSVTGWLGTITDPDGNRNYTILYADLETPPANEDPVAGNSYFQALESAYNVIFEINLVEATVECIYGKDTSDLGSLYDVHMTLESAVGFWLNHYIVEEDREQMRTYLEKILTPGIVAHAKNPLQTEFRLTWDDNVTYSFIGVAIQLNPNAILFCCRDTAKVQYSSQQAREIRAMKKIHAFMERSYELLNHAQASAIFELDDDDNGTLLYISRSLLKFLDFRPDQYLHFMEEGFQLSRIFVYAKKKGLPDMTGLFQGKEIKYQVPGSKEVLTLLLRQTIPHVYEFLALRESAPAVSRIPQVGIFARTFGYFDLFTDGTPVVFSNYKEKELMALLIDRNGGTLSSADAIANLWEDAVLDDKTRARFRKLAMGLKQTLQNYGIDHILIINKGVRSIDTKAITCDYYELLAGNTQYVQSFHNSYMSDYPWAEQTLATLWDYS